VVERIRYFHKQTTLEPLHVGRGKTKIMNNFFQLKNINTYSETQVEINFSR